MAKKYDDYSTAGYVTHKYADKGADYTHPEGHVCQYCNKERIKKVTKEVCDEFKSKYGHDKKGLHA